MQSSELSSSLNKDAKKLAKSNCGILLWAVWICRLLIGGTFILSGIVKLDDLWGTVFKIEDYLSVWNWDIPRTIVMMSALALSMFEFTAGILILTGCYRRIIAWLSLLFMVAMLALTLYIWVYDPVSDCGCFGDFIVLSNSTTFFKNVVLASLSVFLLKFNCRCASLFKAPIQWMVVVSAVFYSIIVALIGYNVQPMLDFRPYKVGTPLVHDFDNGASAVRFIYEKDGEEQAFNIDDLPDEADGWTFVEREDVTVDGESNLTVYDPVLGDDVTAEYLEGADSLLILVLPEPERADLSYTYLINELYDAIINRGGEMIALLATSDKGIARWKDHSMADYPCLKVEDTSLKQLSRGVMSMVWVSNDTIRWKRSVSSLTMNEVEPIVNGSSSMVSLAVDGPGMFKSATLVLVLFLLTLYLLQTIILRFWRSICRKKI